MDLVSRRRARAASHNATKPVLAVRQANRAPLGDITSHNNVENYAKQPSKVSKQSFKIYDECSAGTSMTVDKENVSNNQTAERQQTDWPAPPKVQDPGFWPENPPIPTHSSFSFRSSNAVAPFEIYDDDSTSAKDSPISIIVGTSDRSPNHFSDINPETGLPNYSRDSFRERNESICTTTSPPSEDFEGSSSFTGDESVMYVEEQQQVVYPVPSESDPILNADEYSSEIITHLKSVERKFMPKWNYMTKQPDITFSMRSILVDWLVEVSEEYKLDNETLFLAVNYIDRFLSFMSVQRAKLQLVGTACMFIASKYEEIYPPDVTEFCYITDDTYTKKQVLRMEHLVLEVLRFECSPSTAYYFVNLFSKLSGVPDTSDVKFLAQYLVELTLMEAEMFLHFPPSVIAAGAVALARHTLGVAAWEVSMVAKTGYSVDDFKDCLICLHELFSKAPELPQQAIREKYKNQKYNMVSEIKPTPIF